MLAKGFLLVILIIFSGVFALIALIIGLVKYSSNAQGARGWIIGCLISIAILVGSVFYLTRGIVSKTKEFAENLEQFQLGNLNIPDSLNKLYHYNEDSISQSQQIKFLKELELPADKGKVLDQFYTYFGFRDYYRLPLRYPYSLHCIDSLGLCELYNEANVIRFDVSENGEVYSGLNGIDEFAFNTTCILGSSMESKDSKLIKHYFAYAFDEKKLIEFKAKKELLLYAKEKGFSNDFTFYNSKSYYESF